MARLDQHKRALRNNKHENSHLQNSYNKYGDIFEYKVLEECDQQLLNKKESYYVLLYDSQKNGYNLTSGGGGLNNPSAEVCERIRQQAIEKNFGKNLPHGSGVANPMYGKHHSEETKQKLSEKRKGK